MVGTTTFINGDKGSVAIVGDRSNPKGAMILVPQAGGDPEKRALSDALDLLHPQQVIEIVCMQERVFGSLGLTSPFGG